MLLNLTIRGEASNDSPRRALVNADMVFKIVDPSAAQIAIWPDVGACLFLTFKNDDGYWQTLWVRETPDEILAMQRPRQTVVYGSPEFPIVEPPTRART